MLGQSFLPDVCPLCEGDPQWLPVPSEEDVKALYAAIDLSSQEKSQQFAAAREALLAMVAASGGPPPLGQEPVADSVLGGFGGQIAVPFDHNLREGNVLCFVLLEDAESQPRPLAVLIPKTIEKDPVKMDTRSLAKAVNVRKQFSDNQLKKKIKIATNAECVTLFGHLPWTIPPVGLRSDVQVWLSPTLRDRGPFCFAAGKWGTGIVCTWEVLRDQYGDDRWLES